MKEGISMKAAVINSKGIAPVYDDFANPVADVDNLLLAVNSVSLTMMTRQRASGQFIPGQVYPFVAGMDGIGTKIDGERVYFVSPTSPFGSLAEETIVNYKNMTTVPDGVSDELAATIANPGMSSWTALMDRAHFVPGQTVLINGATSTAGSLAVKVARYLRAGKIIATGRNLEKLSKVGADEVIAFDMTADDGIEKFQDALKDDVVDGIDVVLDYLWGDSAISIMSAMSKFNSFYPAKFVNVGLAGGQIELPIPATLLRFTSMELLGSGAGSITNEQTLKAVDNIFKIAQEVDMSIPTVTYDLSDIKAAWSAPSTPRGVIKVTRES